MSLLDRWRGRLKDEALSAAAAAFELGYGGDRVVGFARALYLPAVGAGVPLWPGGEAASVDEVLSILR